MRVYEELFIVRPDATEEEIEAYIELVSTTITAAGGTVDKVEKWGVRKLAYRVNKRSEGFYILIVFSAGADVAKADVAKQVERRMLVTDLVMKFITVRVDERMKKIDKRRKAREKRAKRRPAPATVTLASGAAMPGAPVAMPGTPGARPAPGAPEAAEPAVVEAPAESES